MNLKKKHVVILGAGISGDLCAIGQRGPVRQTEDNIQHRGWAQHPLATAPPT